MARILIADDDGRDAVVEVETDDDGVHTATCWVHPTWTPATRPGDPLADVIDAAKLHVDLDHSYRPH